MVTIYDINGNVLIELNVNDTSSSYRSIDGRHELTLKYSLDNPTEPPIGAWCLFQNERFELMSHQDVKMKHSRHYEYTLVMKGSYGLLSRFKVRNIIDGRLKFDMVAKPSEFIELIIANLNERDGGWTKGECIEADEKLISFNHTYCNEALNSVAGEFDTEFEVIGKQISLKKVEYNKENPLKLAYGKGNGLKPGVGRTNYEDGLPAVTMFVQGGSRNISYKDYGAIELHLPKSYSFKFDGEKFEGEEGYDSEKAREFTTDHLGSSVTILNGKIGREDSIDLSEIYPSRVGHVSKVVFQYKDLSYPEPDPSWTEEQWNEVQVDIFDNSIPEDLDFNDCLMENNEPLVVAFQSGELAGRDFDATFVKKVNAFELTKQEYSGQPMPQGVFVPKVGDSYAVFNVSLPSSYVSDIQTHSGAEFDALREATRALYEKSDPRFTFSGEVDEIWSKKNWENVGGKLKIGSYVSFVNEEITTDGPVMVRIIGITQNVNNPHCPKIELSNVTHKGSVSSRISQIEDREAHVEELHKDAKQFTKRRFADAQRAIKLLEDAFGEGFEQSIKPVTIQTMMMLVGDESLQFSFVKAIGSDDTDSHNAYFDLETKTFKCDAGIIKHYTLGVNEIRSSFDQKYHYWTMPEFESAVLDDASKDYYVYAVVNSEKDEDNNFQLEDKPIGIKDRLDSEKRYYLLLGLLLAEYEGSRDFMPLYGFTQILPGQITTDVIRSADGGTYFDLANNEIGGVIKFKAGSEGELNLGAQNLLRNSGFTGDYLSEPLADESVMDAAKELFSDPLDHWEAGQGNKVVALEGIATSGYGVEFTDYGDTLRQELHTPMIAGESYVFSFKGRSTAVDSEVTIVLGGQQVTIEIGEEWRTRIVRVTMENAGYGFGITGGHFQICDLQLERGTIATAYSPSFLDNISDRAYYQSLKYVEHALNEGSTTIGGGLVLTNHIKVGNYANKEMIEETGGMQGTYNNPNDPFLWGGGSLDKAIETINKYKDNPSYQPTEEELKQMANFVVTHGGKAILNEAVVRGTIYSQNGVFGGRLQLGFQEIENTHTLTIDDSSSIWLRGIAEDAILTLPENDAFDGWQLNVFAYPVISKMDGQPYIKGSILCPHKTDDRLYYASQIYLPNGGYLQFTYRDGWVLINDQSTGAEYTRVGE